MIVLDAIKNGLKKSLKTFWFVTKIIVPVYFFVKILEYTKLLEYISNFFAPVMQWFGLTGESALALLMGIFLNIYAGIAVISTLVLTTKQITIIAIMLLFCHSMPIETSIIRGLKIPAYQTILIRATSMILIGLILNLLWI